MPFVAGWSESEFRMPRSPNAIDFWRGFALITIFINHIPGIYFEIFTHRNFAMSDSADLFVFLAGWGLRLMYNGSVGVVPVGSLVYSLGGRAISLYAAQMMMVTVAIAILSLAARYLNNPLLLEWHNAAAIFYNPADAHLGIALLSHQLGYFDILPLYVTLMIAAPLFCFMQAKAPAWVLPTSGLIYVLALSFRFNLTTWPGQGEWFFNPFCWQFMFILGFVMASSEGAGRIVRLYLPVLRWIAIPILAFGFWATRTEWWPDIDAIPEPQLFFLISKTYLTPIRLIQFLALVAVGTVLFPYIQRFVPRIVTFLTILGRNSLNVFCVTSLLSLIAQILRFAVNGGIVLDAAILVGGIVIMGITGKVSEWRGWAGATKR
jgi:hypothetical protein